jgi:tetratricopeptide (TPR) repeat protein
MKNRLLVTIALLMCLFFKANSQTESDGFKALANENFVTAKNIFGALANATPAEPTKWYNYGEALFANEQIDSAIIAFSKGINLQPKSATNYAGLGKCYLLQGKMEDAKRNLDKALDLVSGKDAVVPVLVGLAYISADKHNNADKAIEILTKSIGYNVKNSKAYEAVGDAYLVKNDGGNAMTNYEAALEKDKLNKTALLKMGRLYDRAKNYDLAIAQYKSALVIDGTFAPAHKEIADLYFRAKQFDNAKKEFDEYLKYAEDNLDNKIRYVKFLYKAKSFENCASAITTLIPKDPKNHVLYRLQGYSYVEMDNNIEAEKSMEQFFTIAKGDKILPSDYTTYAKVLQKNGKDSLSILFMKKAIEADPENSGEFYSEIMKIAFKQKKYEAVVKQYEENAAKNIKCDVNGNYLAARSYYVLAQWVKADSANAKITQLAPNSPSGWVGRAQCNAQLDPESTQGLAKPYYEKYLEKVKMDDPKNKTNIIQAYSYLGYYAYIQKDNVMAKSFFEKILVIDPSNEKAVEFIKSVK